METRDYFEKVMQDYPRALLAYTFRCKNLHRNGRSLRKYCKDEAIDYNWVMDYKKTYSASKPLAQQSQSFVALSLEEEKPVSVRWGVACLQLQSPEGDCIEIKCKQFRELVSAI